MLYTTYTVIRQKCRETFSINDMGKYLKYREDLDESNWSPKPFGYCNMNDYPNYNAIIARLICYTKKQYYVYKAVSNNTKVGYLSRRQYEKLKIISPKGKEAVEEYLEKTGRMTTMFKLLKRAIDENPLAKWLKNLKLSDEALEKLSRILQKDGEIVLKPVPVQEAYNVELESNRIGSGRRFATSSCMQKDPVKDFYETFNCQAYIAEKQGKNIGRFLTWNTEKGQVYVDRLYCNGGTQDDILYAIDKTWPNALKYPDPNQKMIVKTVKQLNNLKKETFYPYLDTFRFLVASGKEMYLTNHIDEKETKNDYIVVQSASGDPGKKVCVCPKCGKVIFKSTGRYSFYNSISLHYLECEANLPTDYTREVLVELYRLSR